ncbi:MAG: hypothetical protein HQL72_07850 [Magnetococcales bacterium]|nr:hypothetical protein [Magnetococcales bacterium]
MSDDSLVDEMLAIILRRDGSVRYDRMRKDNLEDLLPTEIWNDTGMETMKTLTTQGVFHPLREPLGNIGLELFANSKDRLSQAMEGVGISNSLYANPLVQAIGLTIIDLEKREPKAQQAEMYVQDPEGSAALLQEILTLELSCDVAFKEQNERDACRSHYWELWEFAWARRIFVPEDHVIEALENLYSRYPFLETRLGKRRIPAPPGNLADPRNEEEVEPELW